MAHGFGKNRRARGSRADAGPRGLSWECHTTLSNACQIEQAALIEVIRPKPTQDEAGFRGQSSNREPSGIRCRTRCHASTCCALAQRDSLVTKSHAIRAYEKKGRG